MRNRIDRSQLRQGMEVLSGEGQSLGRIERTDNDSITVNGQQYEFTSIERIEGNRIHLTRQVGASTDRSGARGAAGATAERVGADDDVRIQVREERLDVSKREVELGQVEVRTRVESEQQTVPVELSREEVHVEQRDVADRPATEADLQGAFREGTIRVPVRGEEAVAHKETVVTGEVVIDKERTTETQQITDVIRREVVDVDEDYERHRTNYEQTYAGRNASADMQFADVEPHYRTGYGAGLQARQSGRTWEQSETDLRERYRKAGAGDDAWERLKREVREGFNHARGR